MAKVIRSAALCLLGLCLAAPATRAAGLPLQVGDRANGARLFSLHCAGCHGDGSAAEDPTAAGKALGAPHLRDPAFLGARSDDDLIATVLKGGKGPGSPAFGKWLSLLDAADLVALLRSGLPEVSDVFPAAAADSGKRYVLSGAALARAETLAGGELSASERSVVLFSVYGGDRPATGPRVVPDDPVQLDGLSPKAKIGYVVFGELPARGRAGSGAPGAARGEQPFAMGLARDFTVVRLIGGPGGPDLSRVAPAVVGKGGREPGKRRPFTSRAASEQAQLLTRLYARAVEAAAMAAKEEADRHLFDIPEQASKATGTAE